MSKLLLGCIADDFTGATDLANNLVREGMRTIETIGVPPQGLGTAVDAVVVALKSRTIPVRKAVAQSLEALRWLKAQGAVQIYFKYCSTFDSTPSGNIGPVAEALLDAMASNGSRFTIATPAFPDNGRTVFRGYLFVGDMLLHESSMQHHPLTPMMDSNLVRVLQAQCRGRVGLIDYRVVERGTDAILHRIDELRKQDVQIAIVDAVSNNDLRKLGPALKGMPLVTGGSGVAIGLPANFGIAPSNAASDLPRVSGPRAIVSGSCSAATNRQVRVFGTAGGESYRVDPMQLARGVDVVTQAISWAAPRLSEKPVLIYSTAEPGDVKDVQDHLGVQGTGAVLEQALAAVSRGLVERGVRQLVIAGGETAGACVQALEATQLRIGPQIDPGVPWCHANSAIAPEGLHLALKSGNFGADDFFVKAFATLS
jgi:3-dehydrotetronate 4-kinase